MEITLPNMSFVLYETALPLLTHLRNHTGAVAINLNIPFLWKF